DANVERFCRLIAETAELTGTRFLLITHHRITMAHMDRLFGVTMLEQGVSQLVSVDLARAAELRETQYAAAQYFAVGSPLKGAPGIPARTSRNTLNTRYISDLSKPARALTA